MRIEIFLFFFRFITSLTLSYFFWLNVGDIFQGGYKKIFFYSSIVPYFC